MVFLARTLENSHICERERETEGQRQHQGRRRGHPTGSNTEHPTAVNQSTVNCKVEENRSETSISSIFRAFANDMELADVTNILLEACEQQHHTATEWGDQGETQLRQKLSQLMKENDGQEKGDSIKYDARLGDPVVKIRQGHAAATRSTVTVLDKIGRVDLRPIERWELWTFELWRSTIGSKFCVDVIFSGGRPQECV